MIFGDIFINKKYIGQVNTENAKACGNMSNYFKDLTEGQIKELEKKEVDVNSLKIALNPNEVAKKSVNLLVFLMKF